MAHAFHTFESIQHTTLHPSSLSFFLTRTPIGHDKRTSGVREVPRSLSVCSLSNGTSEVAPTDVRYGNPNYIGDKFGVLAGTHHWPTNSFPGALRIQCQYHSSRDHVLDHT